MSKYRLNFYTSDEIINKDTFDVEKELSDAGYIEIEGNEVGIKNLINMLKTTKPAKKANLVIKSEEI